MTLNFSLFVFSVCVNVAKTPPCVWMVIILICLSPDLKNTKLCCVCVETKNSDIRLSTFTFWHHQFNRSVVWCCRGRSSSLNHLRANIKQPDVCVCVCVCVYMGVISVFCMYWFTCWRQTRLVTSHEYVFALLYVFMYANPVQYYLHTHVCMCKTCAIRHRAIYSCTLQACAVGTCSLISTLNVQCAVTLVCWYFRTLTFNMFL